MLNAMALLYVRPFNTHNDRGSSRFSFLSLAADPARGTATRRYRGGVRGTQFDTAARTAAGDTQLAPAAPHPDPRSGPPSAGVSSAGSALARRVLVAPDRDSKTHDRASIYSL